MSRLLIGNEFPEQLDGSTANRRAGLAWWSLRILWHVRDGDVLLLPEHPDADCLDYVARITATDPATLRVIVPDGGFDTLASGALAGPPLVDAVRAVGGELEEIVPLCPTKAVADLARAVEVPHALPGDAFLAQNGGRLVNGKATFRAVAGGRGVPVPRGEVCDTAGEVVACLMELSLDGPVIVKKDFDQGCHGNLLVSRTLVERTAGAAATHVLGDAASIAAFVAEQWEWLSNSGRHPVVVERFHEGSRALFTELTLLDDGVVLDGDGELIAAPLPDGQIVPAPDVSPEQVAGLRAGALTLAEAYRGLGYRGPLGPDAILTEDGAVLFTEVNGRITGSTHIHGVVGRRVVGDMTGRVLVERQGWVTASFADAVRSIERAGLDYDPVSRTGVVLTMPRNPGTGMVSYTVVAPDIPTAYATERRLAELSPSDRQGAREKPRVTA